MNAMKKTLDVMMSPVMMDVGLFDGPVMVGS
jgi:hypothetical protein